WHKNASFQRLFYTTNIMISRRDFEFFPYEKRKVICHDTGIIHHVAVICSNKAMIPTVCRLKSMSEWDGGGLYI
ncbi:MAG: hypothetical protein IKF16_11360, partial [Lachnospiraceae bacterium]|nr:hypothetical protein [Lachnospiraceae bacterium]